MLESLQDAILQVISCYRAQNDFLVQEKISPVRVVPSDWYAVIGRVPTQTFVILACTVRNSRK